MTAPPVHSPLRLRARNPRRMPRLPTPSIRGGHRPACRCNRPHRKSTPVFKLASFGVLASASAASHSLTAKLSRPLRKMESRPSGATNGNSLAIVRNQHIRLWRCDRPKAGADQQRRPAPNAMGCAGGKSATIRRFPLGADRCRMPACARPRLAGCQPTAPPRPSSRFPPPSGARTHHRNRKACSRRREFPSA